MLSLKNSFIKSVVELEDAKTLQVIEEVPFTTQNEVNGFNTPIGTIVDGDSVQYPKVEDLVFLLYAFHRPYEPIDTEYVELSVSRITNITGERTLSNEDYTDPEFSYLDIAYKWNIDVTNNQGVTEIYMIALEKDDPTNRFFYDTENDRVMESKVGGSEPVLDNYYLINNSTNKSIKKCLYIPEISKTFSDINKKLLFLEKERCDDHKLIKTLKHISFIIRIGGTTAINQAEVGMYTLAQEIVEYIEKIIEEHERLWK